MTPRRSPTLSERCASALLDLQILRGAPIDRETAKSMTAREIISMFHADHDAGYACHGAGNHPTVITMRLIADHRKKTAEIDQPAIAKGKRLSKAQAAHCAVVAAKVGMIAEGEATVRKSRKVRKIRSGPMPCGKTSEWKKPLGKLKAVRRTK